MLSSVRHQTRFISLGVQFSSKNVVAFLDLMLSSSSCLLLPTDILGRTLRTPPPWRRLQRRWPAIVKKFRDRDAQCIGTCKKWKCLKHSSNSLLTASFHVLTFAAASISLASPPMASGDRSRSVPSATSDLNLASWSDAASSMSMASDVTSCAWASSSSQEEEEQWPQLKTEKLSRRVERATCRDLK